MSSRLCVAVLFGGASHEAEVSRVSAREVGAALASRGYEVHPLEADTGLAAALLALRPDVVFPALHGAPGEDGTVQGLLEMLGLPYVGSGVEASAYAMNKVIAKYAFRAAGLPVAREVVIDPHEAPAQAIERIVGTLGDAVAVKPATQGSGLGVTLVRNANQLDAALQLARSFGQRVLVEEFVKGSEITVAVLDRHGENAHALPVVEIRTPENTWYDYEHRYTAGKSEHLVPAPLPAAASSELQRIAVAAHRALGCRDLSRADFVYSESKGAVLLEVNTLPGMTPTSLFPDAARAVGIDFATLMDSLVASALARAGIGLTAKG